jgi:hypothetical protein
MKEILLGSLKLHNIFFFFKWMHKSHIYVKAAIWDVYSNTKLNHVDNLFPSPYLMNKLPNCLPTTQILSRENSKPTIF